MVDTEREMTDTLRSRQKRWLGHILRHDSLLSLIIRITLEGRIIGGKVVEDQEQCSWIGYWRRRKIIPLRPMMKTLAQDRSRWCQWRWKSAIRAEYYSSSSNWYTQRALDFNIFAVLWRLLGMSEIFRRFNCWWPHYWLSRLVSWVLSEWSSEVTRHRL